MASVSEFSLQSMAKDIVQKYKSNMDTESLTVLTKEAVEKEAFNKDQASRLIERVNSEAFLSMYPAKTDFPVADPKIVLASLSPSSPNYAEENAKTASKKSWGMRNMPTLDDIFDTGISKRATEENTPMKKTAREILIDKVYNKAYAEAHRVEKTAAEVDFNECLDKAYSKWREDVLFSEGTAKVAHEVIEGNFDRVEDALKYLDLFQTKLAQDMAVRKSVFEPMPTHVVKTSAESTPVAKLFEELIASADRLNRFW